MGLDNPLHIAFLVVILLLLFGAKRLPEIGRQLGSGMREFKDSVTGSRRPAEPPSRRLCRRRPRSRPRPHPRRPRRDGQAAPQPAAPGPTPAAPVPGQAPVAEPAPVEPSHQA